MRIFADTKYRKAAYAVGSLIVLTWVASVIHPSKYYLHPTRISMEQINPRGPLRKYQGLLHLDQRTEYCMRSDHAGLTPSSIQAEDGA
jgi:hypothetical protein